MDLDEDKNVRLRITVKCRNLLQFDDLSAVSPLVAVFEQDPTTNRFLLIDQTEVQPDELNPNFSTAFVLTRTTRPRAHYMFRVYDASQDRHLTSTHCLGSVVVNINHLWEVCKSGQDSMFQLESSHKKMRQALLEARSTLFLRCQPDPLALPGKAMAELGFQCSLTSVRFRDIIPVIALFQRDAATNSWNYLGQTDQSRAAKSAVFSKRLMVDLDIDELKISVYDTNTMKVSELNRVGSVVVSVRDLTSRLGKITPLQLQPKKKNKVAFDVVIVTCTQKFAAHTRDITTQTITVEKEVDEGPQRIALRDGIAKLESMVLFGRTFHRIFTDPQKDPTPINFFFTSNNVFHWCSEGNRLLHPSRSLKLQDIRAIVVGRQLPAFSFERNICFADECSFSLIGTENILNLAVPESRTREVWVYAIVKIAKEYDCEPAIYLGGEYDHSFDTRQEAPETPDTANNIFLWLKNSRVADPDNGCSPRESRVYNTFPSRSEGGNSEVAEPP